VGRAAELAELRSLVSGGSRLVTIAGPGGIGKSRLALQVAAEVLDSVDDGVWLVELAPVAEPELVARTVPAVLQVREEPGQPMLSLLAAAVGDRYLLVVLDNAEHVLGAARDLADDAVAADALAQLCWLSFEHGDLPAAMAHIDEAVGLARRAGDPRLIAYILSRRAVFKSEAGDLDTAFADNQEAITLSRAAGDHYRLATTLDNLAIDEQATGKLRAARAHLQEASTLADNLGYQNLSAGLRQNLGLVDIIDGNPRHARRHFLDSLDTARITGVTAYLPGAILGLALAAAAAAGDPAIAATLHGVADEHYEQAGRAFEALEAGQRDRDHAQLRATLGDAAFEAAYARGRTLSQAGAIALAVGTADPDPGVAPAVTLPAAGQAMADGSAGLLSEREREIVALLAGGATDAQIAGRLFLSVNTVRSHLERIRDKTGARRRAELVRYAIQAGIEAT